MKHTVPNITRRLICAISVLVLCCPEITEIHAQSREPDLQQQISSLVSNLKAELKDDPKTSGTLGLTIRLRTALDDSDLNAVAALKQDLMRQYDNKYQEELLKILRQVEEHLAGKKAKSQKDWIKQISGFVQEVEAACLEDAPLENLQKLLLKVDDINSLQPKGRHTISVLEKMEREKFDAAVTLLSRWTEYKRYAAFGYEEKASDIIKSLKVSSPRYPILQKSFLEKKYAETERIHATAHMENPEEKNDSDFELELTKLISGLGNGNLDSRSILKIVELLEDLSEKETNDKAIISQNLSNGSLRDLSDCLFYAEKNDLARARVLLTDFIRETVNNKAFKSLREKATIQLLPVLYAQLGAGPPEPGQSLNRYLFELASAPDSLDGIALRNSYMHFYNEFYEYKYRPTWLKSAEDQFQSLSRAASAMNCQDYPNALGHFRTAIFHATKSGPANGEELIHSQIEKIRSIQPILFDPSVAGNLAKMEVIEQRINFYKAQLKKVSARK